MFCISSPGAERSSYLSSGPDVFPVLTAASVTGALGTLMYLILTHDFSVAYVYLVFVDRSAARLSDRQSLGRTGRDIPVVAVLYE